MKIIIDNNIWISFLIGKKMSLLRRIFTDSSIIVYVCNELLREFEDVSQRGKIRKYISDADVRDTFALMKMYCRKVDILHTAQSPIRDAKDLYLLSLADSVEADYIVTGDKDLLVLEKHNQTRIITYSEFRNLLS